MFVYFLQFDDAIGSVFETFLALHDAFQFFLLDGFGSGRCFHRLHSPIVLGLLIIALMKDWLAACESLLGHQLGPSVFIVASEEDLPGLARLIPALVNPSLGSMFRQLVIFEGFLLYFACEVLRVPVAAERVLRSL